MTYSVRNIVIALALAIAAAAAARLHVELQGPGDARPGAGRGHGGHAGHPRRHARREGGRHDGHQGGPAHRRHARRPVDRRRPRGQGRRADRLRRPAGRGGGLPHADRPGRRPLPGQDRARHPRQRRLRQRRPGRGQGGRPRRLLRDVLRQACRRLPDRSSHAPADDRRARPRGADPRPESGPGKLSEEEKDDQAADADAGRVTQADATKIAFIEALKKGDGAAVVSWVAVRPPEGQAVRDADHGREPRVDDRGRRPLNELKTKYSSSSRLIEQAEIDAQNHANDAAAAGLDPADADPTSGGEPAAAATRRRARPPPTPTPSE